MPNLEKLFHIYIGTSYQGCIRATSSVHALGRWAQQQRVSQLILRAEEAKSVQAMKAPTKKEARRAV